MSTTSTAPPLPPPPSSPAASTGRQTSSGHISSTALQSRLSTLRNKSNKLQSSLTQQLATSPSGQKLLHIGPSLSTIPPDLHSLLTSLNPLLNDVEIYKERCEEELKKIETSSEEIRRAEHRAENARDCALIYQDLMAGEKEVNEALQMGQPHAHGDDETTAAGGTSTDDGAYDGAERVALLERAALTTLHLVQQLKNSTQHSAAVMRGDTAGSDTEKAQFLMKLAPRIRRLEIDTIKCLVKTFEELIRRHGEGMERGGRGGDYDLLSIGHCLRGLALLGRGKEAESAFARVAIMPLIRSKISLGRLDEGGSRGQCAGLFSLLDDIACSIADTYGSILRLSEGIFDINTMKSSAKSNGSLSMEVDLVTAGVWLPIATALMADPSIKMAIFSPGIANILQANYTALDVFLSELAERLLKEPPSNDTAESNASKNTDNPDVDQEFAAFYYKPSLTAQNIKTAQQRIYRHPMTSDFSKKWNLPIYYQLRFQECSSRLNKAINTVTVNGWESQVYTGEKKDKKIIKTQGFELSLFIELYDILVWLWKPEVVIRPLTHRFLRGGIQMIQRVLSFVQDGLNGTIKFGAKPDQDGENASESKSTYCWGEQIEHVAAVAWELTVLETSLTHDYPKTIFNSVAPMEEDTPSTTVNTSRELDEIRSLVLDALLEVSQFLSPLIIQSWNDVIVKHLIETCCSPLSAVKGVAATYRMTNRPPPTNPSPFVSTILRPLKTFDDKFSSRTPPHVGDTWKLDVVRVVSEKYCNAVGELLDTIKRTEMALKNRKARRAGMSGGMSDGEKVKLQLFLDFTEFRRTVEELEVENEGDVEGLARLENLTLEGEGLWIERNDG